MELSLPEHPVRVLSADLVGVDATAIEIEASVCSRASGAPRILGLPDAAVREAYHRVRTAFTSLHLSFPHGRIVINLAPARTRKGGSGFDLGLALGLACFTEALARTSVRGLLAVGELGLDGSLRSVPGILSMAQLATRLGVPRLLCPVESAELAQAAAPNVRVLAACDLAEALDLVSRRLDAVPVVEPLSASATAARHPRMPPDLGRVRGQASARKALLVAAAGGHNLLLSGPPGCGKSLLASCMPGLLPRLTVAERLSVLQIRGVLVAGEPPEFAEVLEHGHAPFRAPHHTISYAGLVGGGSPPRPGEVSLAHHGVLFLDELPEFRRETLEALRQPLERGSVHIRRADSSFVFPARFQLIAAMNPCPCGKLGHPTEACVDTPLQIHRYRSRISGPLLDRFDMQLALAPVPARELLATHSDSEPVSPELARRVEELRERQRMRNHGRLNSELEETELRAARILEPAARQLLTAHCERHTLSARAVTRVLRVSRTIADLRDGDRIGEGDLAAALHFRARF